MAAGRAGPVALGIFRSQLLREGGKYLGTRLGGGGGGAPGGSSPYSFLEHGVGGGVTRCVPVCLMPPRPVCSAFSGTRASICAAQGPPSPHAFSCQELGPLWTPSLESLRGKGPGSWAPAWQCPLYARPRPFVPARMGSGLGPSPGLCAGETPQETGLAKWPPFPFSSLGHDCAVSLPEEAQGGRLPFGALSAPGWCPQTLRGQGWAGAL